jgi:hypothetical protein
MDIFSLILMVGTFLLVVTTATNLVPTNTEESKFDRLIVSLLWGVLFLDYLTKFLASLN